MPDFHTLNLQPLTNSKSLKAIIVFMLPLWSTIPLISDYHPWKIESFLKPKTCTV